jgi:hypothetical protein
VTRAILVVGVALSSSMLTSCGPPSGSLDGPCNQDGTCGANLDCDENEKCVRAGSCAGDNGTKHASDCATLPTASCGNPSSSVSVCNAAAQTLRAGVFDAVFACLHAIPASQCNGLDQASSACEPSVDACLDADAQSVCGQADDACNGNGDTTFAFDECLIDLSPANNAVHQAFATCFNDQVPVDGCTNIENQCSTIAFSQVGGGA